jgi:hypothetical protein
MSEFLGNYGFFILIALFMVTLRVWRAGHRLTVTASLEKHR